MTNILWSEIIKLDMTEMQNRVSKATSMFYAYEIILQSNKYVTSGNDV